MGDLIPEKDTLANTKVSLTNAAGRYVPFRPEVETGLGRLVCDPAHTTETRLIPANHRAKAWSGSGKTSTGGNL